MTAAAALASHRCGPHHHHTHTHMLLTQQKSPHGLCTSPPKTSCALTLYHIHTCTCAHTHTRTQNNNDTAWFVHEPTKNGLCSVLIKGRGLVAGQSCATKLRVVCAFGDSKCGMHALLMRSLTPSSRCPPQPCVPSVTGTMSVQQCRLHACNSGPTDAVQHLQFTPHMMIRRTGHSHSTPSVPYA